MEKTKRISLGLQGGGAYGAFAWGVLDRLLADGRLEIDGIAAASAGAINAVALLDGYARGGGREGARRSLERFWTTLGQATALSPLRPSPLDMLMGRGSIETSPGYMLLQLATATLSPEQLYPLNINTLSTLLATLVDFDRVRACDDMSLFVSATNVRTGKGRVFRRDEIDVEHVMASACLPQVFAPVRIDGEAYWDGSFVGNPPLAPLVDGAGDIVVVQNNPIARRDLPYSMADVNNRANEIAFNISLVREISAIQHLDAVLDEESTAQAKRAPVRLHLISGTAVLRDLSISSKFNTEWSFISGLRDLGREAAQRWLDAHFDDVGVVATLDPVQVYMPEAAPAMTG
jgi:NTE family protein